MTREQSLALGNGLIGIGCSFFEVGVLSVLFSFFSGPRPEGAVMLTMLSAGVVTGGLSWWVGHEIIGMVE